MFFFLAVLIGFPPDSQLEPNTYRALSGHSRPLIRAIAHFLQLIQNVGYKRTDNLWTPPEIVGPART
jgi:hypothetical protein